jgi:PAS domain S-box-containing protein
VRDVAGRSATKSQPAVGQSGLRRGGGWTALFGAAFEQSSNAMVLLDANRRILDVNRAGLRLVGRRREDVVGRPAQDIVADGPALTAEEWAQMLVTGRRTGVVDVLCADGTTVTVQWGASVEVVSADPVVLIVALSTSRWGRHFRRTEPPEGGALTDRESEIVRLISLGNTGPEIADELSIAHDTVRTHARNAMTKLGARSRAHLVAKALTDGHVAK